MEWPSADGVDCHFKCFFYRSDGSHVGGADHLQQSRLNVDSGKAYAWGGVGVGNGPL